MGNIDILEDAAARLPHTSRKMFGGHGLFAPNGGMFAGIVDDDQIILKFARGTPEAAAFAEVGGEAWQYKGTQGTMTMSEWLLVPEGMYDDGATLAEWTAKAHRIAPAKGEKTAKKPKAKPAQGKEPVKKPKPASGKRPAKRPTRRPAR